MAEETKNKISNSADGELPPVPLTLEGSFILHQMFHVRWPAWKSLQSSARKELVAQAATMLEKEKQEGAERSAIFSLLGHKGDLMLIHFRPTLEALNEIELLIARSGLSEFLEPFTSYLSVVELGLYEASVSLYRTLTGKGLRAGSPEWDQAVETALAKQRAAAAPRLWPEIPPRRYVCFYPMNKLRGEEKNWYQVPVTERQRMMREHGMIGRRYSGQVTQVISGSIGFDDWEWGVDLFADDPLVFKKLVYEMRFDEASAVYGQFGAFYVGLRLPITGMGDFFEGRLPPSE